MVRTQANMFVNQINLHHINHHHNNLHHLNHHYHNHHYYTPLQPSTNLQWCCSKIAVRPKDPNTTQRHQIFYSRCSVKNKICNLIINNESCDNIISSALVDYLKLETEPHPHPYIIRWIKKGPSIKVTDLCHVPISIGKYYQDIVACNMVDMDACYILLGRSWHHDVKAIHRSKENIYMFN